MRQSFIDSLCEEAKCNPDIWLLTADLGYSFLEKFADQFPNRFVNVGVAEQNMIGIASGLALSGKKVFVYSIINFLTLKCFEQIRNDVVYHNLDVNLIGVGGGFSYGTAGYTHHGIEDINLLSSLPSMRVFAPATAGEIKVDISEMVSSKSPAYLRLEKCISKPTDMNCKNAHLPTVLSEGDEVLVLGYGSIIAEVSETRLEGVKVVSINCINPLDESVILGIAEGYNKVLIIEEHVESVVSLKIENLLLKDDPTRIIKKHFIKASIFSNSGTRSFLRRKNGMSDIELNRSIMMLLQMKQSYLKCR